MTQKNDNFYFSSSKKTKKKKQTKYPKHDRIEPSSKFWLGRGGAIALGYYGMNSDYNNDGGGLGESLLAEFMTDSVVSNSQFAVAMGQNHPVGRNKVRKAFRIHPKEYEEEAEVAQVSQTGGARSGNKIDQARQLFQALINRPDMNRQAMLDTFKTRVGVTHSTAVSYYERLAKEAGLTNQNDRQDLGKSIDMRGSLALQHNRPTQPVEQLPADTHKDFQDQS